MGKKLAGGFAVLAMAIGLSVATPALASAGTSDFDPGGVWRYTGVSFGPYQYYECDQWANWNYPDNAHWCRQRDDQSAVDLLIQ
ncbi:hypothetical protein [Amycolatopsis jejuensis]|uniref:hypothetical protein n=1 Tax=Amycolatopsis jejuensis TaxID=330084 RepID=UPI0005256677|nr:hypothetical protein [Amycolatopsis jejuensis]